jgi:hypothetical protein
LLSRNFLQIIGLFLFDETLLVGTVTFIIELITLKLIPMDVAISLLEIVDQERIDVALEQVEILQMAGTTEFGVLGPDFEVNVWIAPLEQFAQQ